MNQHIPNLENESQARRGKKAGSTSDDKEQKGEDRGIQIPYPGIGGQKRGTCTYRFRMQEPEIETAQATFGERVTEGVQRRGEDGRDQIRYPG